MPTSDQILNFISELHNYRQEGTFNPWSETDSKLDLADDAWINRQSNLYDHMRIDARYLLIGEAPGYQGCRYTGIPFTSERLIADGQIPRLRYLKGIRITNRILPWSEPSATIVWKTLRMLDIHNETVLWNAYPFHPHRINNPTSNRTPCSREMQHGVKFLKLITTMYPLATLIAVGNKSHDSMLEYCNYSCQKVRHPANGGATKFTEQLMHIVQKDPQ